MQSKAKAGNPKYALESAHKARGLGFLGFGLGLERGRAWGLGSFVFSLLLLVQKEKSVPKIFMHALGQLRDDSTEITATNICPIYLSS